MLLSAKALKGDTRDLVQDSKERKNKKGSCLYWNSLNFHIFKPLPQKTNFLRESEFLLKSQNSKTCYTRTGYHDFMLSFEVAP